MPTKEELEQKIATYKIALSNLESELESFKPLKCTYYANGSDPCGAIAVAYFQYINLKRAHGVCENHLMQNLKFNIFESKISVTIRKVKLGDKDI